jgi:hypothetical protein
MREWQAVMAAGAHALGGAAGAESINNNIPDYMRV